jgi:hypothetical protein
MVASAMIGGMLLGTMLAAFVPRQKSPVNAKLPPPALSYPAEKRFAQNELLVKYSGSYTTQERQQFAKEFLGDQYGVVRIEQVFLRPFNVTAVERAFPDRTKRIDTKNPEPSNLARWYKVIFTPQAKNFDLVLKGCVDHQKTEFCEPNFQASVASLELADPLAKGSGAWRQSYGNQYALAQMHVDDAWDEVFDAYADPNADGVANAADIDFLINYIFKGGPAPEPLSRGDVNGDGLVNISDVVALVDYLGLATPTSGQQNDVNGDTKTNWSDVRALNAYIFEGGPAPEPLSRGDINGDSIVNISDVVTLVDILQTFPQESYLTGDVNADGNINEDDTVYLLAYIFEGGPAPLPLASGDVNGDGRVTISDVIVLVNHIHGAYKVGSAAVVTSPTAPDAPAPELPLYLRGDANASGSITADDITYILAYIFSGGPAPDPLSRGDLDGNGLVNVSDAVLLIQLVVPLPRDPAAGDVNNDTAVNQADVDFLVAYIFSGGPAPDPLSRGDLDGNGLVNVSDIVVLVDLTYQAPSGGRGEVTGDGVITFADVYFLIDYIFNGGSAPVPLSVGDVDENGIVNISDVIRLIQFIEANTGSVPTAPVGEPESQQREFAASTTIVPVQDGVIPSFLFGDVNGDGTVTLADVDFLLAYIFEGGTAPDPLSRGDIDQDGLVNISDAVMLINLIGQEPDAQADKGDVNADGRVNWSDADYLLAYIFQDGPAPTPLALGDIDGDGQVNISDVVALVSLLQTRQVDASYIRGDVDNSGNVDRVDIDYLIAYIFSEGRPPVPEGAGDVNRDGRTDVSDVIVLIRMVYPAVSVHEADPSLTVAVLDTGVDTAHPDLAGHIWKNAKERSGNTIDDDANGYVNDYTGWNFVKAEAPLDDMGHGTHMAGIIASGVNTQGIAGVCPTCAIMPVKVMGSDGRGAVDKIVRGVQYAVDNGADILVMGFGFYGDSHLMGDILQYSARLGVSMVAPAGNDARDAKTFMPANHSAVIAVAASDPSGKRVYFSNTGSVVDVLAPGADILSLRARNAKGTRLDMYCFGNPSGKYCGKYSVGAENYRMSGTSASAAYSAGVTALLLTKYPEYTTVQLQTALSAASNGKVLDALKAVQ